MATSKYKTKKTPMPKRIYEIIFGICFFDKKFKNAEIIEAIKIANNKMIAISLATLSAAIITIEVAK
jgi:hypothetical protein